MPSTQRALSVIAIATILVVGSLSGGAVAARMITGRQIKDNTVTTKDIKDKSLRRSDLAPATIKRLSGAAGPTGATGAPGTNGTDGTDGTDGSNGTNGVTAYEVVNAFDPDVPNNASGSAEATCPAGKVAMGGGAFWAGGSGTQLSTLGGNGPERALRDADGTPTGGTAYPNTTVADMWFANGVNHSGGPRYLEVYVICAKVS